MAAENIKEKYEAEKEEFRKQEKVAFLVGYTGSVGFEVLQALVSEKLFSKVVLIGRRKSDFLDDEKYSICVSWSTLPGAQDDLGNI